LQRIAIGNAAGGKSTLARALAAARALPYHEIDRLIPLDVGDWKPADRTAFLERHAAILAEPRWVVDGLGPLATLADLFARADAIVHIDLPIERHVARVLERFEAQRSGRLGAGEPGGDAPQDLDKLFRNLWGHQESVRPHLLRALAPLESAKPVFTLGSQAEIDAFRAAHCRAGG
jgi:hypothetical protein